MNTNLKQKQLTVVIKINLSSKESRSSYANVTLANVCSRFKIEVYITLHFLGILSHSTVIFNSKQNSNSEQKFRLYYYNFTNIVNSTGSKLNVFSR